MDDRLLLMISSFTEKSEKSAPWAFCFIYKFALLPTSVHLLMATTTFSISPFAQVQKKVHLLHVKYRHPSSTTFDNQPIWVFSELVRLSDQPDWLKGQVFCWKLQLLWKLSRFGGQTVIALDLLKLQFLTDTYIVVDLNLLKLNFFGK